MGEDTSRPPAVEEAKSATASADVREIDLVELMQNAREAVILYRGERYRLRITSKDKLILTK